MRFHCLVVVVVISLAILDLSTRATGGTSVQADGRAPPKTDLDSTCQQQQQRQQQQKQSLQEKQQQQEDSGKTEEESPPIGFGMLSIANVIERAPVLQKFHAALVKTNLIDLITGDGPFTVLIPWNKAIVDSDDDLIQKLFSSNDDDGGGMLHLRELLLFHIHFGSVPLVVHNDENNAYAKKMIAMANGQELQMQRNRKQRIHFMDQTQQSMSQIGYHNALNGFGYMMETTFMPPSLLRTLDTTIAEDETSFFYSLLEKAQLIHLFRYDECDDCGQSCVQYSNFTVFAPTNKAFANVKREHVLFLKSPEGSEALRDLLLYHIVPNHVFASVNNLPAHERPAWGENSIDTKLETMLDGQTVVVVFKKQEDAMHVKGGNNASVSNYALAKNGIVQILDTVLIPPVRPPKTTASDGQTSTQKAPADTCSVSDTKTEPMRQLAPTPVAASVATSTPVPVQTKTPTIPAKVIVQASQPTSAPAVTAKPRPRPGPAPSEMWSLPSPTIIDIVNVPLVREGRKIKVILP